MFTEYANVPVVFRFDALAGASALSTVAFAMEALVLHGGLDEHDPPEDDTVPENDDDDREQTDGVAHHHR